jgi:hypothetical protein
MDGVDNARVPSCCDGCGRTAYARVGWTERTVAMGFAGLYCRACTVALRTIELLIQCSGCGRHADEGTAERTGWGYLSDGLELHPVCPACLEPESSTRR